MKRFIYIFAILTCFATSGWSANVGVFAPNNTVRRAVRLLVFSTDQIGYAFVHSSGKFSYVKTTDGGGTWSAAVDINTSTPQVAFDVWFDKWTPGDTGTLIHTWYFDTTNDKVFYRTLDTASDTLGTERTAFTGASAVAGRGAFCSGTKTRSGYLYVAFDIDAGAELGLKRSTDSGVTWDNLSGSFVEATIDECILFPASGTGDNNDMWAIYQDASADQLTMKMWDSSAAAAVESSSMQTMIEGTTDGTGQRGFTGSVRHSDGHLIVVSCSESNSSTADMQAWDVSAVNAASLTGITALTNITTNIQNNYYPSICIDQLTNNLYVFYTGKRDNTETLGSSDKVYYTKSTDGGTTWSAGDTAYDEASAGTESQNWSSISAPSTSSGRVADVFYITTPQLWINKVNSVAVTPTSGNSNFFPFLLP